MKVTIYITKEELKKLVINHIEQKLQGDFDPNHIKIETKSTQNYKSEWESADFRAIYEGEI